VPNVNEIFQSTAEIKLLQV